MRFLSQASLSAIVLLLFMPFSGWTMVASHPSGGLWTNGEFKGVRFFLGTTFDIEQGDMTYSIQGNESGGWRSKLEWPLDSILYIGEIVSFGISDTLSINGGFWKSLTDDAGDMIDEDWLYAYYGSSPFVYSESETTVEAMHLDVNVRYDGFHVERAVLAAIAGFSYSKWDWEAGNGYQTSVHPDYNVGAIQGIGITYEQQVKVPYAGVAVSLSPFQSGDFHLNVYGLYSPKAFCEDEDDHILRYKLNTGESDGHFVSVGGDFRWQVSESWSVTGRIGHSRYDLEGEQDQYFYDDNPRNPDDPPAGTRYDDIDLTVEGSQTYMGFMVGYEF